VNSIREYFHTDWAAMTQHDWIGLIATIVVFVVMIALYFYILHPSNKERLESFRNLPFDEDELSNQNSKEEAHER